MKRLLLNVLFFYSGLAFDFLLAEDFSVQVPNKVGLNQQLIVTVKVVDSSTVPEFISGDFTSSGQISYSSSIQIVNFSKPQKTITYQYALNPKKIGMSSFRVKIGNESKGPFKVEVTQSPAPNQPKPATRPSIFGNTPSSVFAENEAFVKNEFKKKSFYINEPIEVIRTVYHRVNIAGLQMVKQEEFKGFGREANLNFNNTPSVVNQNGFSYKASPVESFVLFPHIPGEAILEGGVIHLQKRGSFFNNPSKKFKIPNQKIVIKEFPTKDKPKHFTRAVGNFFFTLQADKRKVKTHDPITVKLTISGRGNFYSIIPPEINFTQNDIDIKQSSIKNDFVMSNGMHIGEKIIEYYLIPTRDGKFTLPRVAFSFFNPQNKKYQTKFSKPISFEVLKRVGEDKLSSSFDSLKGNDVELLKRDIRYIKTKLLSQGNGFIDFLSTSLIGLSFFIMTFTGLYYSKQRGLFFFKNRQKKEILSKTKKSLKKINHIKDDKEFFSELQTIIFDNLSKQFKISNGYSTSQIKSEFKENKSLYPIICSLMEVVNTCQSHQFAPKKITQDKERLMKKTLLCFQDIENLS